MICIYIYYSFYVVIRLLTLIVFVPCIYTYTPKTRSPVNLPHKHRHRHQGPNCCPDGGGEEAIRPGTGLVEFDLLGQVGAGDLVIRL